MQKQANRVSMDLTESYLVRKLYCGNHINYIAYKSFFNCIFSINLLFKIMKIFYLFQYVLF